MVVARGVAPLVLVTGRSRTEDQHGVMEYAAAERGTLLSDLCRSGEREEELLELVDREPVFDLGSAFWVGDAELHR